jgi:hypothetical protein
MPVRIERYVAQINPHPHARLMLNRLPQMLYMLHEYTRIDRAENRSAVLVAILPRQAAHNLAIASELALAAGPGGGSSSGEGSGSTAPQTIEELLEFRTDLSFDQMSLEFAMEGLAQQVRDSAGDLPFEFDIRIIGGDLQLSGITRNQQIRDFAAVGSTVAEILTALVMKGNPVTTVREPSEIDQKLVWVVAPDPALPGRKIVLVTTRDAAATHGYSLPAVFQPQ